jgi:methylmalonyl-CoA mutase C-terminal domain/subunit
MADAAPPIRVLIAKPGLDGHDRGAKVVTRALRDAGFEVVYTGRHRSVEEIAVTAIEEDVDVVGLSVLSGAHLDYCTRLARQLETAGAGDISLLVGGVIPDADTAQLASLGYAVFGTGSHLDDIIEFVGKGRRTSR